jgi:hypothetical protein
MQHFVRPTTYVPFRRFGGNARREFMQRLFAALYGALGSYLRDALQEGLVFPFPSFCLAASTAFSCNNLIYWRAGGTSSSRPSPCARSRAFQLTDSSVAHDADMAQRSRRERRLLVPHWLVPVATRCSAPQLLVAAVNTVRHYATVERYLALLSRGCVSTVYGRRNYNLVLKSPVAA